mgnify:CR=1 FL=1
MQAPCWRGWCKSPLDLLVSAPFWMKLAEQKRRGQSLIVSQVGRPLSNGCIWRPCYWKQVSGFHIFQAEEFGLVVV